MQAIQKSNAVKINVVVHKMKQQEQRFILHRVQTAIRLLLQEIVIEPVNYLQALHRLLENL